MIKCSLPTLKFCNLIKKEVINICNGCRLGYVCDIEIDESDIDDISLEDEFEISEDMVKADLDHGTDDEAQGRE